MFLAALRKWVKFVEQPSRRGRRSRRHLRAVRPRLWLEMLEVRDVPSTVNWIGGSGNWSDASHWLDQTTMTNHVPTASDDAAIAVAGVTVTHGGGTDSVNSLSLSNGTFTLSGGSLHANTNIQGNSTFNFSGGTILNTTVAAGLTLRGGGGTLAGMTLNGDLDLTTVNGGAVYLQDGLTLNGTLSLGNASGSTYATVYFVNNQTLSGSGNILFGGSASNGLRNSATNITVTLGANLTVHGKNGGIYVYFNGFTLINQGTIAADVAGGIITIQPTTWSSSGTLRAAGGTLNLANTWSNTGLADASAGGTLNLGGSGRTTTPLTANNATVNFTGTLDNTGIILTLAGSGSFRLLGGRINGGIITGSPLTGTGTLAILDGVTLNTDLDLTTASHVNVEVIDGLTLNGTISLGDSAGMTYGILYLGGIETIGGSGSILLGGHLTNQLNIFNGNVYTVTLGPSLTVHGKNGSFFATSGSTFINQGTIAADVSGGTISIVNDTWTNYGTVLAQNGGTFSATQPTNYSSGTLTGGTWQVFDNSILRIPMSAGLVANAATVLLDGANAHFYSNTGTADALAPFNNNAAVGIFTIQNGRTITSPGDFSDAGTLVVGPGSTFTATGTYSQAGALNVQAAGIMSVTGTFANFASGTLTGGTYQIAGTFQFPGAAITTNAATIVLDGAASQIVDQNANDALAALASNSGSFTIQNGRTLNLAGDFSDTGTLTVGSGSTFTDNGNYTEMGMVTVGSGGTLNLAGTFANFNAGTLTGGAYQISGTFRFSGAAIVTNAATLILDGALARIIDQSGANALASLTTNGAAGSFTLQNGRNLTTTGAFENDGALTVGASSTLTVTVTAINPGSLAVLASGTVDLAIGGASSGTINDAGTLTIGIGASLLVNGTLTDTGTITVPAGATLELAGSGGGSGNLSVAGTLLLDAGASLTLGGSYSQSGNLTVADTATLTLNGAFANFTSSTLTGGTYDILGTFQFTGANVVTNAANLILDGPDAQILDEATNNALANFATNAAGGSFTIQNGANLTTASAFSNVGNLTIGAGSTLNVGGNYVQTAGTTTLASGTLSASGLVDLQGGILSGSGTINASLRNAARIDVGGIGTAGLLSINGDYTQTAAGILNIEIGGHNPGVDYDQLMISGQATLDGTLNVSLINGFVPTSGDSFQILTAGTGVNGTFAGGTIDPAFLPPQYDPMDVTLVAS